MAAIGEVTDGYAKACVDQDLLGELDRLQRTCVGCPSPLYYAEKFSVDIGADVWPRREDLNHTGSHKANNILGQALLVKHMDKKNIIVETRAGQHGVAIVTACTLLGFNCRIYTGKVDAIRQHLNITHMRLLGTEVIEVEVGSEALEGAINEVMHFWVSHTDDTYYRPGTATGPHPPPTMICDLQRIISAEARQQILMEIGSLSDAVVTCVGGDSNTIDVFYHFIDDESVRLIGAETDGDGVETGRHAAPISVADNPGVPRGSFAALMQNEDGQITESYSIPAGLNYPGMSPKHFYLVDIDCVSYLPVTDTQAMQVFQDLTWMEDILPAIESAHAMAAARFINDDLDEKLSRKPLIIVNIPGCGDKDVNAAAKWFNLVGKS